MRAVANWLMRAATLVGTFTPLLHSQASRDSAGVLIVENARPAWNDSERLFLAATPRVMIGNTTDSAYRFRQVRGVMLLTDGRIAVADGASLQLRLFSSQGRFLSASAGKGNEPGQIPPHPIGSRWTESLSLSLVTDSSSTRRELGTLPYLEMEQVSSGPTPIWLSSVGVVAATDDRFYAGFGNRYQIQVYGSDGKLRSIIRRAWTPTPITADDWERWVVEWSKLWVRTTGAERERDIQKVRESPWAEENPAFSQFIVDRGGRLWVREAHWQDAIAAGSLLDSPAVPSVWSVFDSRGRWLGDVSMPTGFLPFEIGTDYVAGILRADGVNHVTIYGLSARGR